MTILLEKQSVDKVNIVCLRWGTEPYTLDYVTNLYYGLVKHTSMQFIFHVFTDRPDDFVDYPEWVVHTLPDWHLPSEKAWWYKMELFNPVHNLGDRTLYIDLDVVITGDVASMLTYQSRKFVICQDFNRVYHPDYNSPNSSVMAWSGNVGIYEHFIQHRPSIVSRLRGDQDYIREVVPSMQFWPHDWVMSYRWEIWRGGHISLENRTYRYTEDRSFIPPDCKIISFHGRPNPHEIQDTDPNLFNQWSQKS